MLHLRLIIFSVGGDVPVDSETLLVIDFVNLKIKLAQSFECAHKSRVCVCVFIGVSVHTCMNICVCTVFLKKERYIGKYPDQYASLLHINKRNIVHHYVYL
jgi:hypothetical protein